MKDRPFEYHLFSGLGSSVLPGLREPMEEIEAIVDDLPSEVDAKTHIWNDWEPVASGIIARHYGKRRMPVVVLVGHSNGVWACSEIAKKLSDHDISVKYVAAISPTLKPTRPMAATVKRCDEFLEAWSFIQLWRNDTRGRVTLDSNSTRLKTFSDLPGGHVGVANTDAVHRRILKITARLIARHA